MSLASARALKTKQTRHAACSPKPHIWVQPGTRASKINPKLNYNQWPHAGTHLLASDTDSPKHHPRIPTESEPTREIPNFLALRGKETNNNKSNNQLCDLWWSLSNAAWF